jgi:hypothetical protein|tara:strand:+ start:676 stop:900 length:225 start_codon:yes stop_codon:yes gene_type:complete
MIDTIVAVFPLGCPFFQAMPPKMSPIIPNKAGPLVDRNHANAPPMIARIPKTRPVVANPPPLLPLLAPPPDERT